MADLHPIVIPPLEHIHKSLKFTCSGEGLYKDNWLYDPHPEKFFPPKTTKANPIPKEVEKKHTAYWKAQCAFRGLNQSGAISDLQLRLREAKKKILPELKAAETELNKDFKKKNKAARDGSWNSLRTVEQKAKANPAKFLAEAFPKGATGRPANLDIVVVKSPHDVRLALGIAAENAGLEFVSVDAPWTAGKKPSPDRWIIIGRTRDAVWNQMRETEREAARSHTGGEEPKVKKVKISKDTGSSPTKSGTPKVTPKSKAPVKAEAKPPPAAQAPRTKQTARKNAFPSPPPRFEPPRRPSDLPDYSSSLHGYSSVSSAKAPRPKQTSRKSAFPDSSESESDEPPAAKFKMKQTARKTAFPSPPPPSSATAKGKHTWDVCGSWAINCPKIEDGWGPEGDDPSLTLDIYLEKKNGHHQLFAIFHLRIITGVMRFQKPVPVPKSQKAGGSSSKRKWDEIDDDGDVNMADYPSYSGDAQGNKKYNVKEFYLGATDSPTARRPTWRYRWRGEETGEGEIQLGSDEAVQAITFSDKGDKLSGTFKSDYTGECHFTGEKVATMPWGSRVDPEMEWENRSQAAYDYASHSRW